MDEKVELREKMLEEKKMLVVDWAGRCWARASVVAQHLLVF